MFKTVFSHAPGGSNFQGKEIKSRYSLEILVSASFIKHRRNQPGNANIHADAARARGNHWASEMDSASLQLSAFSVWRKRSVMGGKVSLERGLIRNGAEK